MDLNTKSVIRNAWRITSQRGRTCLRIRVPGGHLPAELMTDIQQIAQQYGNGSVHITTRQGFEVPGIRFEDMAAVNRRMQPILDALEVAIGVPMGQRGSGYPAAGTRNVAACIGSRVCPFANYDTTALAARIERQVYPNHRHLKIACTGCPNDCIKAHLQDFGILGQTDVQLDAARCIGCEACQKNCKARVTDALEMRHGRPVRDADQCIGCGECVLKCPTGAWRRSATKYYRMIILGRTGKKNPRLAATFLEWATEEVILAVLRNVYPFIETHIDNRLPKEHLGYIVDRVGYETFKNALLKGVTLNDKAVVAGELHFAGYRHRPQTHEPRHEPSGR
ncbi:MAG: sulfite reductase subunit C [Planctomycetaceae bacterium]